MFRSLVLNKILHKHTGNGSKNTKKYIHKILRIKYEKQNKLRKINHVKGALSLKDGGL